MTLALGYLLLIAVPFAAIAYLIWDHKRKAADREAVSALRLRELLAASPEVEVSATEDPATSAGAKAGTVEPSARAQPVGTPVPLYVTRARVLTPPQTLLYLLLKTGLPDHIILPRTSLAAVLEAGPGLKGFARDEQIRRLSALTVDFVIADRSMLPLAIVELRLDAEASAAQADRDAVRIRVAAAGIRYVELDAHALPRKDAIRNLVIDSTHAGAEPAAMGAGVPG